MRYRKREKSIFKNSSNFSAAVLKGSAALFLSTRFKQKQVILTKKTLIFAYHPMLMTLYSGRSPPFQMNFQLKIHLKGNRNMFFSKKFKKIFKNLVFWVFSNGIVSEGEKNRLAETDWSQPLVAARPSNQEGGEL